ncbi:hypothetical protein IAT38_001485 [Cryptococcus sp. DSM 104549]
MRHDDTALYTQVDETRTYVINPNNQQPVLSTHHKQHFTDNRPWKPHPPPSLPPSIFLGGVGIIVLLLATISLQLLSLSFQLSPPNTFGTSLGGILSLSRSGQQHQVNGQTAEASLDSVKVEPVGVPSANVSDVWVKAEDVGPVDNGITAEEEVISPNAQASPASWIDVGWGRQRLDHLLLSLSTRRASDTLELVDWIEKEKTVAFDRIVQSSKSTNWPTLEGRLYGSPSRGESTDVPDYFYTWTAQSSMAISSLLSLNHSGQNIGELIPNWIEAQSCIQARKNPSGTMDSGGLNEPKFTAGSSSPLGKGVECARPQRHAPALRALITLRYAHHLLDDYRPYGAKYVWDWLYHPTKMTNTWDVRNCRCHSISNLPSSIIKKDLNEVARGWWKGGWNIWEDDFGHHLLHLAVSMRALEAGAALAKRYRDQAAAELYSRQALEIADHLQKFKDPHSGLWRVRLSLEEIRAADGSADAPTAEQQKLLKKRRESQGDIVDQQDCSLPLAIIYGTLPLTQAGPIPLTPIANFSSSDPGVLASLHEYILSFDGLYGVNMWRRWTDGWALGRHKSDTYNGGVDASFGTTGGAWYVCTFSVAHVFYLARQELLQAGLIRVTPLSAPFWTAVLGDGSVDKNGVTWDRGTAGGQFERALKRLGEVGDGFMSVGKKHSGDGRLREQFDRDTGKPRGARDLTWSYSSFLDAAIARGNTTTWDD